MADLTKHPALGIVIAELEHRQEDIESLLGLDPDSALLEPVDVGQLRMAAKDLVKLAGFLALEAYGDAPRARGALQELLFLLPGVPWEEE